MSRIARRLLASGALAALAVGVLAGPAAAHVTVNSPGATQGGFAVLTFRVPNERDVPTFGLKVQFPKDQPLQSVSVKPKAGWTYTVTREKLEAPIQDSHGEEITEAVGVIDWRSTTGIKAGEFEEFQVSVGPLPEVDQLSFPAIQVYQGGDEVAWIQDASNGAEPERPAPTLTLTKAQPEGAQAKEAAQGDGTSGTAAPDDDAASKGSVVVALVVGALGIVAGVAGILLGLMARRSSSENTVKT